MASGGDNISQINNFPPQEAYILYGAVVSRPNINDCLWPVAVDVVNLRYDNYIRGAPSYVLTQATNATMICLGWAWLQCAYAHTHCDAYPDDTSDLFFTCLQAGTFAAKKPSGDLCDPAFPCHSSLSTAAKVALGVLLSIIVTVFIAVGMWYYYRHKGHHSIYWDWATWTSQAISSHFTLGLT